MGRRRGRRLATVGVVLTGIALTGVLPAASPASAAAKAVTCSSLSGNLNTTPIAFALGGCTGNTGGSGTAEGETITWSNGQITYLSTAAFTPSTSRKQGHCPTLSTRYLVTDVVAGDTTGSLKVGGALTAQVCILNEAADPWSLVPKTKLKLR